jgi:hypothetical protein
LGSHNRIEVGVPSSAAPIDAVEQNEPRRIDRIRRIADRQDEVELFERMLRTPDARRVLLLEGDSELGKSTLLAELAFVAETILGARSCVRADFKSGLVLKELFSQFHAVVGDGKSTAYNTQLGTAPVQVNIQANLTGATLGESNEVVVQPTIQPGSVNLTQQLGEAVLRDLDTSSKSLVLIMDTFEAATAETSRWIIQHLLPAVRYNPRLYIVLGGKSVPHPKDYHLTWGEFAHHRVLLPVTSVEDWYEFARSRHPDFPREYIEALCAGGLTNRPSVIRELIDNVVRQLPPPKEPPRPLS